MASRPVKPPVDPADRKKLGELRLIWGMAAAYPGHIACALAALIVTSSATLAIPYGFKRVIDRGFIAGGGSVASVGNSFRYLLMIVVVLAIATALRFYFVSWLGERVVADLRRKVQGNLLRLAPRFFEENRPSEIASRLTSDTAIVEQVVGSTVSIALRNVFTGIGGIIYLFALSPKLASTLMVAIPVIIVPILLLGRRVRNFSRSSQDRIADIGAMVAETLGAMKIVQAFNQEKREADRFGGAVEAAFHVAERRITARAGMTAIIIGLIFGSITLVLWEGAPRAA
jgi:ATP-binding cassette subfamily B protein